MQKSTTKDFSNLSFEKITTVNSFDDLQCKSINSKTEKALRNAQLVFLKNVVDYGFSNFLSSSASVEKQVIDEQIHEHLKKIQILYYNNSPEKFYKEQKLLYIKLHQTSLSDSDKIFGEFLIGLTRYYLSVLLLFGFWEDNQNKIVPNLFGLNLLEIKEQITSAQNLGFFSSINKIAVCGGKMLAALLQYFNETGENYWIFMEQYFDKLPELKKLAKILVSTQTIPNNRRFLGFAQILHWHGFGGTGELFLGHTQVSALLPQVMNYHGNKSQGSHFQDHLKIVSKMRNDLARYSTSIITAALLHTCPLNKIFIKDLCSGPKFSATAPIIDALTARGTQVILDVSDIDGGNLVSLCEN